MKNWKFFIVITNQALRYLKKLKTLKLPLLLLKLQPFRKHSCLFLGLDPLCGVAARLAQAKAHRVKPVLMMRRASNTHP
jgi:hypothetical protein